jgi:hypothetical protein
MIGNQTWRGLRVEAVTERLPGFWSEMMVSDSGVILLGWDAEPLVTDGLQRCVIGPQGRAEPLADTTPPEGGH